MYFYYAHPSSAHQHWCSSRYTCSCPWGVQQSLPRITGGGVLLLNISSGVWKSSHRHLTKIYVSITPGDKLQVSNFDYPLTSYTIVDRHGEDAEGTTLKYYMCSSTCAHLHITYSNPQAQYVRSERCHEWRFTFVWTMTIITSTVWFVYLTNEPPSNSMITVILLLYTFLPHCL